MFNSNSHLSNRMTLTLVLLSLQPIETSSILMRNTILKEDLDDSRCLQALGHLTTGTTQSMVIPVSLLTNLGQGILEEVLSLPEVIRDTNAGEVGPLLQQEVDRIPSSDGVAEGILHSGAKGSSTTMETLEKEGVRKNGRPEREQRETREKEKRERDAN